MANNSLRYGFTASEVLNLLESQELCDDESGLATHLLVSDDESDGCDESMGGYIAEDGTEQQVEPVYLCPSSTTVIFEAQGSPLPAERNSMLLLDPDLNDSSEQSELRSNQEYSRQNLIDEIDDSNFMDYEQPSSNCGLEDGSVTNTHKDRILEIVCNSVPGRQMFIYISIVIMTKA